MTVDRAFDVDAYRTQLRATWDGLGPAWERWQDFFERGAGTVTSWLIDAAGIAPGDRVLDIATGAGEPALTIATVVGPSGRVVGVDQSSAMVEVARRREAGIAQAEFAIDDVEALDYSSGEFDVVVRRFGLMFAPDLPRALARIADVLAPGGRLAFATWTDPQRTPVISQGFGVAAALLELPAPPPGQPGPFSMSDPEATGALLRDAGFTDVRSELVVATFSATSVDEFVEYATATLPPWLKGLLVQRFGPELGEFATALADAAGRFVDGDGALTVPSVAVCTSARRP